MRIMLSPRRYFGIGLLLVIAAIPIGLSERILLAQSVPPGMPPAGPGPFPTLQFIDPLSGPLNEGPQQPAGTATLNAGTTVFMSAVNYGSTPPGGQNNYFMNSWVRYCTVDAAGNWSAPSDFTLQKSGYWTNVASSNNVSDSESGSVN